MTNSDGASHETTDRFDVPEKTRIPRALDRRGAETKVTHPRACPLALRGHDAVPDLITR